MENKFPDEHAALEKEVRSPCSLHVVSREKFLNWLELQNEEEKYEEIKISLTIVVEVTLIYLFSSLVGWSFMEAFSLVV